MVWTKAAPRLLAIMALAALFVAYVRSERASEPLRSPLQQIARRLRVGMNSDEVHEIMRIADGIRLRHSIAVNHGDHVAYCSDPERGESLSLSFVDKGDIIAGHYDSRLVRWDLRR